MPSPHICNGDWRRRVEGWTARRIRVLIDLAQRIKIPTRDELHGSGLAMRTRADLRSTPWGFAGSASEWRVEIPSSRRETQVRSGARAPRADAVTARRS